MQRSSSLLDFVASLDDEISLPYLSMSVSVSHPGLDALGGVRRSSPEGSPRAVQPDADFRRAPPPRASSATDAPCKAQAALDAAQPADLADDEMSCSHTLGGLRLTYPHSLAGLTSPNSSLTVDYTARERGIKFTIAPKKLRIRKRTLLWLFVTQVSMVVGFVSHASAFGGWQALAAGGLGLGTMGARFGGTLGAGSAHAPAIRMVASLPGHGGTRRPIGGVGGRARPGAGAGADSPLLTAGSAGMGPQAFSAHGAPSAHPVAHLAASAVGAFAGSLDAAVERSRAMAETLDEARERANADWGKLTSELERTASSLSSSCSEYMAAQAELLEVARDALRPPTDAAAHWWAPGMPPYSEASPPAAAAAPSLGATGSAAAVAADGAPAATAADALAGAQAGTCAAALGAASSVQAAAAFPAGFERELAVLFANLCGIAYHCSHEHSAPSPTTAADTVRIAAELEEMGLELLETFRDRDIDTFAFLAGEKLPPSGGESGGAAAAESRRLFLIFRGSVSHLNKDLNLDFFRCGYDAAEDCFEGLAAAAGEAGAAQQGSSASARPAGTAVQPGGRHHHHHRSARQARAAARQWGLLGGAVRQPAIPAWATGGADAAGGAAAPSAHGEKLGAYAHLAAEVRQQARGGRGVVEPADAPAAATAGAASAASAGSEVLVHRGFLRAWQSLRVPILTAIERLGRAEGRHGRNVELHVSGHSLGGAMAMLASAEIAHLARRFAPPSGAQKPASMLESLSPTALLDSLRNGGKKQPPGQLVSHKLYTFAAPRIGNEAFAAHFAKAFCSDSSYWAVQSGGDAVPHLPLQAMGFHHPPGRIVTLNKYGRVGIHLDTGDDRLYAWVPRGFNPENWVRTHDIFSYSSELQDLVRGKRP